MSVTEMFVNRWAEMHGMTITEAINDIQHKLIHGQKEKEPFAEGSRENNSYDQF